MKFNPATDTLTFSPKMIDAYLEAIRVLELWGDVGAMRALVVLRQGLLP